MEKKGNTCCFTGHRIIEKEKIPQIKKGLEEEIINLIYQDVFYFGSGGALGFDTLAALTVLELREKYPQIKLIMVLPCRNQDMKWSTADQASYQALLNAADKIVYVSERYFDGCMHKRNRHLVDSSAVCVCYYTEAPGGTAYTVGYARGKGLEVINLA